MITHAVNFNFVVATLDPRITFTRSDATATRVNASGYIESVAADTARFDFNPVTLANRGLLIEEQRTNLLTRSEEFDNAAWAKVNTTISANAMTAPDGTLTADKLVETAVTGTKQFYRPGNVSVTNGIEYTVSIFLKAAERNLVLIQLASQAFGPGNLLNLNIATQTVYMGNGTNIRNINIIPYPNGWLRFSVTSTAIATVSSALTDIRLSATLGDNGGYTGDGTSGIYLWGAQLEVGAFPTSYIPTTTAAVTRNADVATITGTNFSDWWQASKGGVLVRARPGTVSGTRPWLQFDDGTANEIIALRGNTTNPELYIVDGGTPQAQIDAGTIAANTDYSLTGWWQTNDCKARLDSGAVVTDTTATIPTVTQARLGSDGTNYLNGHLASISYYDTFSG